MLENIIELIFPRTLECPLCGRVRGSEVACVHCQSLFKSYLSLPKCNRCGRFFRVSESDHEFFNSELLCADCLNKAPLFELARSMGPYEGLLKEGLAKFKYTGVQSLAKVFATFLADMVINEPSFHELLKDSRNTVLVPVPLASEKEQQRGFNQSKLLAQELGKILSFKVVDKVLVKVIDTPSQAKLGKEARIMNLRGAFKVVNSELLRKRKVLLIDDIFTTGATVEECTEALINAGVKTISALTVAAGYKPTPEELPVIKQEEDSDNFDNILPKI